MVKEELKYQILQQFGFQPTSEQAHALEVFAQFLTDTTPHCAMILRGSAGTGKTSLSGAIVRTLQAICQKVMLLALRYSRLTAVALPIPFIAVSTVRNLLPVWMENSI